MSAIESALGLFLGFPLIALVLLLLASLIKGDSK